MHFPARNVALAILVILLATSDLSEQRSIFLQRLQSQHIRHIRIIDVNKPASANPAGQMGANHTVASIPRRRRRKRQLTSV